MNLFRYGFLVTFIGAVQQNRYIYFQNSPYLSKLKNIAKSHNVTYTKDRDMLG